jgi:hypothetical protein
LTATGARTTSWRKHIWVISPLDCSGNSKAVSCTTDDGPAQVIRGSRPVCNFYIPLWASLGSERWKRGETGWARGVTAELGLGRPPFMPLQASGKEFMDGGSGRTVLSDLRFLLFCSF